LKTQRDELNEANEFLAASLAASAKTRADENDKHASRTILFNQILMRLAVGRVGRLFGGMQREAERLISAAVEGKPDVRADLDQVNWEIDGLHLRMILRAPTLAEDE
jgi:hypothetical protein